MWRVDLAGNWQVERDAELLPQEGHYGTPYLRSRKFSSMEARGPRIIIAALREMTSGGVAAVVNP